MAEEERQVDAINGLDDSEENLRIVTAIAQPSLGLSGSDKGLLDQQDQEVVGVDVAQSVGNEGEEESELPFSLDSSLEKVFGPGATRLAEELENSEFENVKVSAPSKDQKKKRGRKNFNVGEVNCFQGVKDNHGVSYEGEHFEEAVKEVKKPRLGSSETQEEEGNIAEDKTDSSEELAEEIVGDKDLTTMMIPLVLLS